MKSMKLNLWILCAAMVASTVFGQWPYGASDATYGLRSRVDSDPGFTYTPSPEDWRDINMYQLFTDRFADGDTANNNIEPSWYVGTRSFPDNRNFHHGGDWKGLKDNLDYLSGMGVKAIWMSGVQMNDQGKDPNYTPYHMYHPTDFFKCDPTMGTFQELTDLIDACHARGIYVVLDVVINHMADKNGLPDGTDDKYYHPSGGNNFSWWDSGNQHAAPFNDLQWFHNNGTINNWDSYPEYIYGQFKGTDDLKTEDSNVQGWLDQAFKNLIDATDCDGFRVDAIKHVEYDWIKAWADGIRQHAAFRGKNDFILFGEYFSYDNNTLASYCKDSDYSFNAALFFPMSQTIKSVFVDDGWTGQLTQSLDAKSGYGEGANRLVTFIDNHDVNRIGLQDGGDVGNIVWDMRPALSFLYLATPVPCLFYGTEHAFQQGGHWNGSNAGTDYDDADWQRECMFDRGFQPGPAQGNKLAATDAPLYQHIAALNNARANHKSLTRGSFSERYQTGSAGAYAFSRVYDDEESLVALNTSDGSVSISPAVDKPDGTVFVNALNESESVTSSGGTIAVTLSGKETKIFVAGVSEPEMWVRSTQSEPVNGDITAVTPIFINTEAGPTGVVASATLGFSADGGSTWNVLPMVETNGVSQDGTWYGVRLGTYPADTVIEYYVEIADASDNKIWDNNGGANYFLTVNAPDGVWIRGTSHDPLDGAVTDATDFYVNSEAGPSGSVTRISTVYSTDAGATWLPTNMTFNPAWGSDGGEWYNLNLGLFAADTTVQFYIEATDGVTTNMDDNNGLYYSVTVTGGGSNSNDLWVGLTDQTPENGTVTPADTVVLTAETWPIGAATNVGMAFSTDAGANWQAALFTMGATNGNNDTWTVDMGSFADGTVVSYAIFSQSATREEWDNNGGSNHQIIVGEVGGLRMVQHTPVINDGNPGTTPDNPDDEFDFATTGGAATTGGTNGFGSFGSIYVNYDETYLYIGGTGVALPDDSQNNAYMVMLGGGTNEGSPNFWGPTGAPYGLDNTHNAAFQPSVNLAILLGDVYGDGTFTNFEMYVGGGFDFGQGVFSTAAGASTFAAVDGAAISQFGGYGMDSRLAANWECAIPLATFGVTNASDLTNLYVSGLMVTGDTNPTNSNNRFISGRYLGDSATLGNEEVADEYGNFAFSFVNLGGTKVLPPQSGNADLGVPDSWVSTNFPPGYVLTDTSDFNSDGRPDRHAYFAGLDPTTNDSLVILSQGGGRMAVYKVGGQACSYVVDTADEVIDGNWNWTPRATAVSLDGAMDMPSLDVASYMMRVRVNVPPVNQPVDSVSVSATPPGGSFSSSNVTVTLSVSGVNVTSSTYTVEGGSATDYVNGDTIVFGDGLAVDASRTLTLDGSTINGVTTQKVYTFTRTEASLQISWTGNVGTDPTGGAWDAGEALAISFETAPLNAAVSAGIAYSSDGGSTWTSTDMTAGTANASNDTWSINLGSGFSAGTTVQYALVATDGQGNPTWNNNNNNNYSISVNGGGGGDLPYSTNPTKGLYRASGITIDGDNTGGEWTDSMLIALDVVNDDPRSLGENWTMHEAPLDFSHLWACWDDDNVYIAWQMVDVTDVVDPSNAGGGDPISRNDGILIWAALDTKSGGNSGIGGDMWTKSNHWSGVNLPDYQIYMAGSLWQSYMSTALSSDTWAGDTELGTTYNTTAGWGIDVANSAALIASDAYGVWDCDDRVNDSGTFTNFKTSGHARTDRDSFYEMKIPMASIGITKAQLESTGIAVMLGAGSLSAMDTIPNSSGTSDTPGVETYNSSFEWGDADTYSENFARIGN